MYTVGASFSKQFSEGDGKEIEEHGMDGRFNN